ncbi:MAG TPA: DUF1398 family protein [Acetobacteraceae bacterium]|nr:DUF1398 family protein [Acetobacteraceae bacterium]
MDTNAKNIVREMTRASNEERITFPEVVKALMAAGVERYHADLIAGHKTYHMPDDSFEIVPSHKTSATAQTFSAESVQKALHAIQGKEIGYREFCERIAAAGCVGYFVSLAGRRAVYYGRALDTYVEWFPGAKP